MIRKHCMPNRVANESTLAESPFVVATHLEVQGSFWTRGLRRVGAAFGAPESHCPQILDVDVFAYTILIWKLRRSFGAYCSRTSLKVSPGHRKGRKSA